MKTFLNISRLNDNGTLDTSFADNGVFLTDNNNSQLNYGWQMAIQNDNKIIAIGLSSPTELTNKSTLICRLDVDVDLGASQNANEINFDIFPNPAANEIIIVGINPESKIELYDILGKSFKVLKNVIGENQTEIDISNFSPGTYMLKIQSDRKTAIKKIIVK